VERTLPLAPFPEPAVAEAVALAVELPDADELLEPEGAAAAPKIPPCTVSGEVPWELAAAEMYASRVLPLDGGLTTMAIPAWQWPVKEQYIHKGSVLLTWKCQTSPWFGKPEYTPVPPLRGVQGLAKSLCATEWPALKVNSIMSPTAAVTVSGVNFSAGPTVTWWMPAVEAAAVALAVEEVVVGSLSPYWGLARVDVASTERMRVAEESTECILSWCVYADCGESLCGSSGGAEVDR